tara:strand:+ start:184 stop:495 length:312 start_codon:yes stop_codon:yes gene_type:complete
MFAVELHDTTEQLTEKVEDEENHAVIVEKVAEGAYSTTSAPVLRSPPPPAPPPPASGAVSRLTLVCLLTLSAALHAQAMSFLRKQSAELDRDAWMYTDEKPAT